MSIDSMDIEASVLDQAKIIWSFLRIVDELHAADMALILGGHDPSVGPHAALLFHKGLIPWIVISGGSTHVPPAIDGAPANTEAEAIASYLEHAGVPRRSILLEKKATNTSENFWYTADLLEQAGVNVKSCILVTKPYQERRALATGKKRWPHVELQVSGPSIKFEDYIAGPIPVRRILSMLAGEVQRIANYSSEGFLEVQIIPEEVMNASNILLQAGYSDRAI